MERERENGERMGKWRERYFFSLHVFSFSPLHLNFLILSSFSLSLFSHSFSVSSPFSHSLAIFSLSPFPYCIFIFSFYRHFPSLHFLIFSPISHSLAIFLSASPFTNFVLHFLSIFSSHSIFKLSFVDA